MSRTAQAERGAADERLLAGRIMARVRQADQVWGTYALDLTLDALLECSLAMDEPAFREHVLGVMGRRHEDLEAAVAAGQRPFGHVEYTIARCLDRPNLARLFVRAARRVREETARSPDGLVLHPSREGRPCVLADFMQDYVARMARAGELTGESSFFEEAAEQVRLHRDLLRDPATGLWRQGHGWDPADRAALSPGAWSRGQGWVLRGLSDALTAMPARPEARIVRVALVELLEAVRPLQGAGGFWACLPDAPAGKSSPETSGTAFAAAAIYRALAAGHVSGEVWWNAADRAFAAIAGRVGAGGRVTGACAGPGPLNARLRQRCFGGCRALDESHGTFTVLYACAARAVAAGARSRPTVASAPA